MAGGDRIILLASDGHDLVGCAQLLLAARPNARHRAEVQKLLVHTQSQKQGLGRRLLAAIEKAAEQKGRSLLLADARLGGPGERLFTGAGYTKLGAIPGYQRGPDGKLDSTVIFYRNLPARATGR